MEVSVSYIKSKFNKKDTIKKIDESNANYIHVDLMDGVYVENKNFTIGEVVKDLKNVMLPLDIHLMVKNPDKYIMDLAMLNTEFITFHASASKNPRKTIEYIKSMGIRVGLAINPDEDIESIKEYLGDIDLILFMSVVPGLGGQEFIESVISKIKDFDKKDLLLSIDGGINESSIELIRELPLDIVVSGSYICMEDNFNKRINVLKDKFSE